MSNPITDVLRIDVETRARQVTFFEDRAEVIRVGQATVGPGVSTLCLSGVTVLVDDQSIVPNVVGPAKLLSVCVTRLCRETLTGSPEELADSEADQKTTAARRVAAERALEIAQVHEGRTTALLTAWIAALGRVPRGAAANLTGWKMAFDQLNEAQTAALDRLSAAHKELFDAKQDEKRAQLRHQTARRLKPMRVSTVDLQVEAAETAALTIEISYVTPCALWRPEHLAKLQQNPDGSSGLEVVTSAVLWQRCGEEWRDVVCRFSTARPAQNASPPLLSDDCLRLRRKTDAERKVIVVEAREQSVALAGLGRGSQKVEEMPGVDDGGEPLVFEAHRPVTIASSGQPMRIEVANLQVAAQVERVVWPEKGMAAHLRATATLVGPRPLLAGPVLLVRGGELCGRGKIKFVGRGEPFELGFGPDDGIRVRRQVVEKREQTAITNTQHIDRTIKLYLSNLSARSRKLLVTERVPVSEIREVEVTIERTSGMRWDGKDGFAHFDVELPAHGTRELLLSYHVEAPSRVVLPSA